MKINMTNCKSWEFFLASFMDICSHPSRGIWYLLTRLFDFSYIIREMPPLYALISADDTLYHYHLFSCCLTDLQPTLGNCRGRRFIKPVLITAFYLIFELKMRVIFVTRLGVPSLAECPVRSGMTAFWFWFTLWH